jgi:Trm5-related predicted tRNA methylase
MRPGVFWEAIVAWQADKEADRRHVAEVIRGVGVRLFNIQLKPKDQIRDVRQFLPFPWDDEEPSNEEAERLAALSKEDQAAEAMAFLERINAKCKK